jgi:hypothetical protein
MPASLKMGLQVPRKSTPVLCNQDIAVLLNLDQDVGIGSPGRRCPGVAYSQYLNTEIPP